jgi:integrase
MQEQANSASSNPAAFNPSKFHATRHRGLSTRRRNDGSIVSYWGFLPGRGRIKLQGANEREALREFNQLRGQGLAAKVAPHNVRFAAAAERWWESHESPQATSTRQLYRAALDREILPKLGHRKLAEIDLQALQGLIAVWKGRGLSRSTVENYLCPVRGVFKYAIRHGLAVSNPCAMLENVDLPAASDSKIHEWSQEEIETLLQSSRYLARQPEARQDYSHLLTVAGYTGLRLGELLGLEWGDIELGERPVLHVRRQWTKHGEVTATKTKNGLRRVPLWPEAVEALKAQRGDRIARPDEPTFTSRDGGRLQHRNVQRRGFEAARDHAKLPKELTFHSLRHAFASLAYHRGVPLAVVSAVMGHSTVQVTATVYVHLWGRDEAEDAFRAAAGQDAAFQAGRQLEPKKPELRLVKSLREGRRDDE